MIKQGQRRKCVRAALLAAAFSLLSIPSSAQSPPMGFKKVTVLGKMGLANRITFVSIGLVRPSVGQFVVDEQTVSVEGRTILRLRNAIFTVDQYSLASSPHYVQITNGPNAGVISEIISTGPDSLTLADNLLEAIVAGETKVRIHPYWTLSTAFPYGGGLSSGLSSASADNIALLPPSGGTQIYFFHASSGRWRRGLEDASHVKIPPGAGMMITRKRPGNVELTFSGEVLTIPVELIVGSSANAPASTMLGNPFPVTTSPLVAIGLYTGDERTGMVGGLSAAASDNLVVYDPSTATPKTHYYHSSSGKWKSGLTDASLTTIPAGSSFIVTRKAARSPFSWYMHPPPMSLD